MIHFIEPFKQEKILRTCYYSIECKATILKGLFLGFWYFKGLFLGFCWVLKEGRAEE